MDHFAVAEEEWSKIYSTADLIPDIKRKMDKFVERLVGASKDLAGSVSGVSVDVHDGETAGVLKSFAGTSNFRAGWDLNNVDLAGVLVFTSQDLSGDPVVQLKVFFPAWSSSPYLLQKDGARIEKAKLRPGESFEHIVLATVIRKQVDMSA